MRLLLGITIGLVSIIAGAGFTAALGRLFFASPAEWIAAPRVFWLVGFLAYIPAHILFHRFIVIHIFGHELTHALWSALFGGRIHEIYVSRSKGGFTTYSRGNFLVTLAPYFFPLYAIIFLIVWVLAAPVFKPWLAAAVGFCTCFHIMLTLYSLKLGQSDIRKSGFFPAITFIFAMNCIVIGAIFCAVTGASDIRSFLADGASVFPHLWGSSGTIVVSWVGRLFSRTG